MNYEPLFQPIELGAIALPNRILMAPMTRSRAAQPGDVPSDLAVEYYRQRATAGLILTEATQIAPEGKGYPFTPGIYSDEQAAGWRKVTDAVHAAGGRIMAQLWHVGRISHPAFQPGGALPVAPSAIRPQVQTYLGPEEGMADLPTPRALEASELPGIIDQYRRAAENALRAGFDGVQLHGANGYLIDQFLRSGTNRRSDLYGGSALNRAAFPLRVVEAIAGVWGGDRVSVRISPTSPFNDMSDAKPFETFTVFAKELNRYQLAFLEVVEAVKDGRATDEQLSVTKGIREVFDGPMVLNGGYTAERAVEAVESGLAAAISFGIPFIGNPDLPERIRIGAPLAESDPATYYGGAAEGYTDYPALAPSAATA